MADILTPTRIQTTAAQNISDNRASEFVRHILNEIREYDATLDDAHEVGVRLVNFGQAVTFHLEGVEYSDPSLIYFSGTTTNASEPVKLIQHVSQISILLMKLPRLHPEKPKIGFLIPQRREEDD